MTGFRSLVLTPSRQPSFFCFLSAPPRQPQLGPLVLQAHQHLRPKILLRPSSICDQKSQHSSEKKGKQFVVVDARIQ